MTLQAFALLCALATLSCVASAVRRSQSVFLLSGLLVGILLLQPSLLALPFAPLLAVEPAQVALLLVLFALGRLRGTVGARMALFIGGALAIVWLQALRGIGWPAFAALPFVVVAVVVAFSFGLKRGFCPPALQDEVALLLLCAGLVVALVPHMLDGWNSAQAFQGSGAAATVADQNVLWVAAGFVVLGAVFAWWKSGSRRWGR